MIRARLDQLAGWCGATLHGADDSMTIAGVGSDSRGLAPGNLFVALRGERVDGHAFLARAAAAGAAAALVEQVDPAVALPQLQVDDAVLALGRIARGWLQQCPALRIGLTGSNGKTTVKTLAAAMLAEAGPTYANPGNRNNELGLPLAACALGPEHRYAIFEMGAGKPGDIAYLCDIAPPQVALVNNIAAAHLERLGTLQGVADTKAAVYRALPADGVAVINADDAYAADFAAAAAGRRQLRFGLDAVACEIGAEALAATAVGSRFELRIEDARATVELRLPGLHNVRNALAAAALAHAAGASLAQIAAGLERAPSVPGRLQRIVDRRGWVLLDDSYNANPGSFEAGLRALALAGGRCWVAMGQMAELGPDAAALHAGIGRLARELGIERLLATGPLGAAAAAAAGPIGEHYADHAALAAELARTLAPGVTLLVKGSRSAGMERVVAALQAPTPQATGVPAC